MMSASSDEDLYWTAAAILLTSTSTNNLTKKNRKKRSIWTKNWLQRRSQHTTVLHMLDNELLLEDPASYRNFLRLDNPAFELLLTSIKSNIEKQDTVMRDSIPARHRLEVTLRFLATGDTFRSLMYSTRIHESTISRFIPEICSAIYTNLKDKYLRLPNTEEEWRNIANKFYDLWNFPNCLGALDGKHVKFRVPISAGSYYHNYKGDHSIVLLGLADAEYKFTYVNVGVNGRVSDGGVFRECTLAQALVDNSFNFPPSTPLPGKSVNMPYVVVADDAFPLKERIMKPYSQTGLTHDRRIYNYRLSRARRIIENAFGIMSNRFRILLNPINLSVDKVELITLSCIVLHNFIFSHNGHQYSDIQDDEIALNRLECIQLGHSNRSSTEARNIREEFKDFFNTSGAVTWQNVQIEKNNM